MSVKLIAGKSGSIAVFGAELVSQKLQDIIAYTLEKEIDESGINSIVFRNDGKPILDTNDDSTMWMTVPDSRAIVCNLKNCVHHSIQQSVQHKEEHYDVGLKGLIWHSILAGAFHEMFHSQSFIEDDHGEKLYMAMKAAKRTKELQAYLDKEEERADDYAEQMLFTLAKKIDLEVDFGQELESFIMGEIEATIKEMEQVKNCKKAARWVEYQKFMLANNGLYIRKSDNEDDDMAERMVSEFKTYLHLCSGDAADDADWNTSTIGIPIMATERPAVSHQQPVDFAATANMPAPEMVQQATFDESMREAEDDYILDDDEYILDDEIPEQNREALNIMTPNFNQTPAPAEIGAQGGAMAQPQPVPYSPPQAQQPQPVFQPNNPQGQQPVPYTPPGGAQPYTPPVAGSPAPSPVVGEKAYDVPFNGDGVKYQQVVRGLYTKLVGHIFEGCQFNPHYQPFFLAAQNISNLVGLSPDEDVVVKEMTIDNNGKRSAGHEVHNVVKGCFIDNACTLPGYILTMTSADGNQIKRKLIPQNPHKVNKVTGVLSSTAQEAMNGAKIVWIVDENAKDKQFALRMYNGQLQSNQQGSWVNV